MANRALLYSIWTVCGYLLDLVAFFIMLEWAMPPFFANMIAFTLGASFNILGFRFVVFQNTVLSLPKDLLYSFAVLAFIQLVASFFIDIAIRYHEIMPIIAKLSMNLCTFILNYVIRVKFFMRS